MHSTVLRLVSLFLSLSAAVVFAADCTNPIGIWKSTGGSTLVIKDVDQATDVMNVTFESAKSLYNDGPFNGVGFLGNTSTGKDKRDEDKASTIGFNIKFPNGVVSTWAGYCTLTKGKPKITSIWTGSDPDVDKSIDHMKTHPTIFYPVEEIQDGSIL